MRLAEGESRVSPEWDFDSQVSVDGHRQEAEDRALSEHQDEAGEEEAAVEVAGQPDADGDGEGDGEAADQDISDSQRHQEVVGGGFEVGVDGDGPAHQHVADDRQHSDDQFNGDVESIHLREETQRAPPPPESRLHSGQTAAARATSPSPALSSHLTDISEQQTNKQTNLGQTLHPALISKSNTHTHTHTLLEFLTLSLFLLSCYSVQLRSGNARPSPASQTCP